MTRKKTLEDFIDDARAVHGDRYDYHAVIYSNNKAKVEIACPEHDYFWQAPYNHIILKQGCPVCGGTKRKDHLEFVADAVAVHGDKYTYPEKYTNDRTKITIVCPEHGEFKQSPDNHLHRQSGCPMCSPCARLTSEQVIKRCRDKWGDKYEYLGEYKNNYTPMTIVCPEHGKFKQTMDDHIRGSTGCPACSKHGFDPTAPALFYVADLYSPKARELRVKVGITNRSFAERFLTQERNGTEITALAKYSFKNGGDARALEKQTHEHFSEYNSPNYYMLASNNGWTELFDYKVKDEILAYVAAQVPKVGSLA